MKKNDFKNPLRGALLLLLSMSVGVATAQDSDIYVSNGATLHYEAGNFASGVIDNNNGGTFSVASDFVHSADNYVEGPVTFLAANTFDVSLETASPDRSPNFSSTGLATMSYDATAVPTGTPPAGYVLASAEVYTFTGNVSAGTATPLASTTFGAATGPLAIVFADANGGTWSTTVTPGTTTVMSFAKEDVTLGLEELNASTFAFYPNPVTATTTRINFNLPQSVQQLDVTMYDITGKVIKKYNNVAVQTGANSIDKPQVANGMYLLQFSFNNGAQQITKRLLVK